MTRANAKEIFLEPSCRKRLEQLQKTLDQVVALQSANGNWNYSPYMHGMLNGLIMAQAWAHGESDPKFMSAPEEWLQDREVDGVTVSEPAVVVKALAEQLVVMESDKTAG